MRSETRCSRARTSGSASFARTNSQARVLEQDLARERAGESLRRTGTRRRSRDARVHRSLCKTSRAIAASAAVISGSCAAVSGPPRPPERAQRFDAHRLLPAPCRRRRASRVEGGPCPQLAADRLAGAFAWRHDRPDLLGEERRAGRVRPPPQPRSSASTSARWRPSASGSCSSTIAAPPCISSVTTGAAPRAAPPRCARNSPASGVPPRRGASVSSDCAAKTNERPWSGGRRAPCCSGNVARSVSSAIVTTRSSPSRRFSCGRPRRPARRGRRRARARRPRSMNLSCSPGRSPRRRPPPVNGSELGRALAQRPPRLVADVVEAGAGRRLDPIEGDRDRRDERGPGERAGEDFFPARSGISRDPDSSTAVPGRRSRGSRVRATRLLTPSRRASGRDGETDPSATGSRANGMRCAVLFCALAAVPTQAAIPAPPSASRPRPLRRRRRRRPRSCCATTAASTSSTAAS